MCHAARLGVAAAVLVGAVSGCGSGHGRSSTDGSAFRGNIAAWSLPLDAYIADQRAQNDAQNAVYSSCMRARGIAAPRYNVSDYLPPTTNKVLRQLFDLPIAQRYGYHPGPTKRDPTHVPRPKLRTRADITAARACVGRMKQRLHLDAELTAFAQTLAGRAEDRSMSDRRVTAAIARWRTCMQPLGLPDLAPSPMAMPTPSQRKRFGMTGPVNPTRANVPRHHSLASSVEIKEATFDARCRISSGYAQTFYRVEVADQLEMMSHYPAELAVVRTAQQRSAVAIEEVLGTERPAG
jgi:hypothetical protein